MPLVVSSVTPSLPPARQRSPWTTIAARALVLVGALLVLAAIGHVAARRATAIASSLDAGELRSTLPVDPPDAAPPAAPVVIPAPAAPPPPTTAPSTRATPEDPVYINYATAEELRRLPGVGQKRAEAIVELRGRLGRFQRVEELMRVKGIGRSTIRKLRPLVRLGQPDAGAS